jgi:Cu2+-exporting ATPase
VSTELKNRGLELRICSGDSSVAVADCARRVAIEHWAFRQSPKDKITYINDLKNSGKTVLMVGDGVNDGPVLAAANVSMTVHGASDVANSAADFILTGISLDGLRIGLNAAHKAKKLFNQNISWALLYNASVIPLAVSGWLQPWMAALGMSASSLLVVLNATRMRKKTSGAAGSDAGSFGIVRAARTGKRLEADSP